MYFLTGERKELVSSLEEFLCQCKRISHNFPENNILTYFYSVQNSVIPTVLQIPIRELRQSTVHLKPFGLLPRASPPHMYVQSQNVTHGNPGNQQLCTPKALLVAIHLFKDQTMALSEILSKLLGTTPKFTVGPLI